jgi:hypothetical protein
VELCQIGVTQVFLKEEVDEHVGLLVDEAEAGEVDDLLVGPHELVEDEVGVELYPHHAVYLSLEDILDEHQEVVSQDEGPAA